VDGVLTDGGLYYNDSGEFLQRFHVRDGLGMKRLEAGGIRVAVVSGRGSPALRKRVEELGVSLVRTNVTDKASACRDIMQDAGITRLQTACIGDDVPDLSAFEACGISFAVADAPEAVRRAATFTLNRKGGEGAFREAADRILSAAGKETLSIGPGGPGHAKTAGNSKLRSIKEAVRSPKNSI
jgi:3-deoxy-manno-octulosonate cytidylyltransferase (CMP-KDO synthetase)